MSLSKFRNELLDLQLAFLWECWSSIGVAGYQENNFTYIVDPEALLLYTFCIGRYDNRLYDEVMDWCRVNGQFFSISRLKRLLKNCDTSVVKQVGVLAEILSEQTVHKKWNTLRKLGQNSEHTEKLFYLKTGEELPIVGKKDELFRKYGMERNELRLRGYSQPFNPLVSQSFLLKLRSLMGGTARCEILTALLTGEEKHPSHLARETGYYQKTVQDTIVEMTWSGVVSARQRGREKLYRLTSGFLGSLCIVDDMFFPHWIDNLPLCVKLWNIIEKASLKALSISTLLLLLTNELNKNNMDIVLQSESMVIETFKKLLRN